MSGDTPEDAHAPRVGEHPADGRLSRPVRRAGDLSAEAVGDSYALYDATTGKVHLLNETAAIAWDLADGTRSPGQIGREVARAFSGDPAAVARDVEELLRRMREEGLIEDRENG